MPKQVTCQFCATHSATITAQRVLPSGKNARLQLCERCGYIHQRIGQFQVLEHSLPAPPCLLCGNLSEFTKECHNKAGDLLGRYRVCANCVGRQDVTIADLLRTATAWTPGILELPCP